MLHWSSLVPLTLLPRLGRVFSARWVLLHVRRVYILILTILISFVSIALFVVLRLFLGWLSLLLDRLITLLLVFLIVLPPLSFITIVVLSRILSSRWWNVRRERLQRRLLMLERLVLVVGVHHLLRPVHVRRCVLLRVHLLPQGYLHMLLVVEEVLLLVHLSLLLHRVGVHEDILLELLLNWVLHLVLL